MLLQPTLLLLLLVLPIFVVLFVWRGIVRRIAIGRIGDEDLVQQLLQQVSHTRRRLKSVLWLTALAALIVALARPAWGTETEIIRAEGQQIIFVVDVSRSMDGADITPTRLERAKLDMRSIMSRVEGAEYGIVLFARRGLRYMPLTDNIQIAELFVDAISTRAISIQGTNLPDALANADALFHDETTSNRTVIIMTDGENHEGDPLTATRDITTSNARVHTLGYGSEEGAPVPLIDDVGNIVEYRTYDDNTPVISRLNEDTLRQVARIGGGVYQRSRGADYLEPIIESIQRNASNSIGDDVITRPIERFSIFAAIALLALSLEILLPEARRKVS